MLKLTVHLGLDPTRARALALVRFVLLTELHAL
jgi:hypothetical protein